MHKDVNGVRKTEMGLLWPGYLQCATKIGLIQMLSEQPLWPIPWMLNGLHKTRPPTATG